MKDEIEGKILAKKFPSRRRFELVKSRLTAERAGRGVEIFHNVRGFCFLNFIWRLE